MFIFFLIRSRYYFLCRADSNRSACYRLHWTLDPLSIKDSKAVFSGMSDFKAMFRAAKATRDSGKLVSCCKTQ